jgi:CxxC-x17-CxxC domain-containing protein
MPIKKPETIKVECENCGKTDKVFFVNDLVRPYLCIKCYRRRYYGKR